MVVPPPLKILSLDAHLMIERGGSRKGGIGCVRGSVERGC